MKRAYVMSARAEAAQRTGERILATALARFAAEAYDEVTLDQIAADAEVTVQTVLRHFGSKEGVVNRLAEIGVARVEAQRREAPVGDIRGAVTNLVDHYEAEGDLMLHLLRQEDRVSAFAGIAARGRKVHAQWCERVFASWLEPRAAIDRRRLRAQLVAICDLYTWFLLRRQHGLSRRQTESALVELLEGILS